MQKTWEEKLKEAQVIQQERKAALEDMGVTMKAVVSRLPTLSLFLSLTTATANETTLGESE
jgi:hypothetical protein